ncbi:hypothetical protein [Fodinibius halophilus]|uniref:Uncharacterized protein n=1 Tax=Fodinibius halophilus TaxID=1736908 RepID=A0A6M1T330_9BACT|nr:hypothetical protein [Fodinibius halophilus]NGP87023.1 hypothetical protein [Fodinibius halophilus]
MMISSSIRRLLLLLVGGMIVVLAACDSAPVDKRYLESEDYKQFRKTQKEEYVAQVDNRRTLEKYLNTLVQCKKTTELSFPLQITKNVLKKEGGNCGALTNYFSTGFKVKMVGYSFFKPIFIRWVLLQRETVYKNIELLAVTHKGTTMLDFQKVGKFRKNLSQNISTDIRVSQKGDFVYITSVSERNLIYPIEQQQVITNGYIVNRNGKVSIQQ